MRVSLVDTEVKKSATLSMRLIPQHKDEIVMAAHEEGTNVSDLLVKAFFYYWKDKAKTEEKRKIAEEMYKGMERATRRARPVIRAALESSSEMSLLDYVLHRKRKFGLWYRSEARKGSPLAASNPFWERARA